MRCSAIDAGRQPVALFAELPQPAGDAVLRGRERSKARAGIRTNFVQRRNRLRRVFDLIAAKIALPDKFRKIFQPQIQSGAVVAAGDLGKRPLDVALAAVKLREKLLDRAPGVEHRSKALLQRLLLGANGANARFEIDRLVAALLNLGEALRLGNPPLQCGDGVFGIAAGEMGHVGFGVDLCLAQILHARPRAVQAHFERRRRLALPGEPVP